MTDLTQRIERIKAECRRIIDLGKKATPGPWLVTHKPHCSGFYVTDGQWSLGGGGCIADTRWHKLRRENACFIAASRTFTPLAAQAVLTAIEAIEVAESMIYAVQNDYDESPPQWWIEKRTQVVLSFERIADQWEGK